MEDDRSKGLLRNKKFWVRSVSGFVMSCVLVALFVLGGDVMLIAFGIISCIGGFELNRALGVEKSGLGIVSLAATAAYYVFIKFASRDYLGETVESNRFIYILIIFVIALIVMLTIFVLTFPKYELYQVFGAFFGVFYVSISFSLLYLLRITPPAGAYLVWLAVLSSWGCDIPAYFFGMKLGKHQLVPNLSPKKSIEGAIGGVVGSMALAAIYGFCVQQYIPSIKLAPLVFALFCMVGAVVGQVGDLAASAIKRKTGIKDYGKILPGHGGILDRFDSMILVAPIVYLVSIYAIMVA